jgi:ABC-type multidrug transport system fused ATPase/permease subunit
MNETPEPPHAGGAFARLGDLGEGGHTDRLGFRLVLAILWRCIRLLRPVRGHVLVLALGFGALAMVVLPTVLILFDLFWTRALPGEPLSEAAALSLNLDPAVATHVEMIAPAARRSIARIAVALGLALFGTAIPIGIGLWYYQVWILQRVNQLLRIELLDRLQALSLRFHAESRVGDAIYRLYQDSAMVTQLIDVLFLTPVFAITRFVFTLGIVAAFDPRMSLILVLVWLPALLLGARFSRPLRVGFRAAREANSALTSSIQETLAGIKVIKAYGAERREQERFEAQSREAFRRALGARSRFAVFGVATFWLAGGALLVTSGWAAELTRQHAPLLAGAALTGLGLGIWNLGLYNGFKYVIGSGGTDQIRLLFRTWGRTQDIAIGLDRVFELLDLEPEVRNAADALDLPPVRESIVFRDVGFRYQPDRPALEQIDLEARVGAVTAVVGPTGSGKSTLMALLLRLFDPDRGGIEIDGVDLRRLRVESLRRRIAIALQENVLFGTTIRENIRYALPNATDEQVREAARIACADRFIEALPKGYDTPLGERGAKLSSGQRQRLSIARSLLKNPDVLILDEPTAALDAETEIEVLRNLAEWGRNRAIFLITHRLSTIRSADRIAVLRDGRIAEQGSHEQLMREPAGAYRRLVEGATAPARSAPRRVSL